MQHGGFESLGDSSPVRGNDLKWTLQFVKCRRPEGADELFLVRYIIGGSVGCQYRTNGQWLNISQPLDEHAWFFLNAPGEDWSLYDLSQSDEPGIGVEVGYLTEQAVAWYDHEGERSAIAYEIFGAKEQLSQLRY